MRPETIRTPYLLGALVGLGAFICPAAARADLVAPFANTIDVDPTYVSPATGATDIAWAQDGRAVVTTKGGTIVVRQTNGSLVQRTGVFAGVSQTAEQGLLGVVADPTVANTFYFYVSNGTDGGGADRHRVFKGVLNADNSFTIDTTTPIIGAARNNGPGIQGPANHNGGGMVIYQNRLYVGVGDTGANASPPTNKYSSCLNRPNGKILRVALDGSTPTDNPLNSVAMVTACDDAGRTGGPWTSAAPDRRVYSWGFRNPWRFWIDPMTGRLWVGDVGEVTREEISVGTGDSHFGYPFFEGMQDWSMSGGMLRLQKMCNQAFEPSRACTPAVHDYTHSGGANCVVGGLIPEGCGWSTALGGTLMYWFADNGAGWIHALTVRADRTGVMSSTATNVGTFANTGPASIRMGPDQSLYVAMNRGNAVYRFTPRDRTGCMGGAGGAGGMGGMSAGNGGSGTMAGNGGVSTGGLGGVGNAGGAAGAGGATAGAGGDVIGPGGTGAGGAAAGAAGSGTAGAATTTGGASGASTAGGASPLGGAPAGGASSGGASTTGGGTSDRNANDIDDSGGCGCRLTRSGGAGTIALALGLFLAFGARIRRRRNGNHR